MIEGGAMGGGWWSWAPDLGAVGGAREGRVSEKGEENRALGRTREVEGRMADRGRRDGRWTVKLGAGLESCGEAREKAG